MGQAARLAVARLRVTDRATTTPDLLEALRGYESMLVQVTRNRLIEAVESTDLDLEWLGEDDQ